MMYAQGQLLALEQLGLLSQEKTAAGGIRQAVLSRALDTLLYPLGQTHRAVRPAARLSKKIGPRATGGLIGTAPFLAPLGAATGGITGAVTSDEGQRGKGFLRGALLGGAVGGLAAGTHGAIRHGLSKVPQHKLVHSREAGRAISVLNPERSRQTQRIFREAAGIAGATGIGAGLLARKREK